MDMNQPVPPEVDRYKNVHSFAVLYSGGLDSTAVPLIIGPHATGSIHLLTYFHHYGTFFNDWSKKHTPELERELGEGRVHHHLIDIHDYYDELGISTLLKDYREYKSSFNLCLGCQQSMAARTIIYCLEHNITNVYICSSLGGEYAEMSMPVTREKNTDNYRRYGIRYDAPLLRMKIAKPAERAVLKKHNIHPGYGIRRSVQGYQPMCAIGLQHILDVLFDFRLRYPPEQVSRYLDAKFLIMDKLIRDYFTGKGMDLDALIAANKAQFDREEERLAAWDAAHAPTESATS